MVTGSTLNSTPILPVYSTPAQESSGEPTEDEHTVDQPVDDEPETEPGPPATGSN
jgi:hypothetical protein